MKRKSGAAGNRFGVPGARVGAFRRRLARSNFFKTVVESFVLRNLQTLVGLAGAILIAGLLGPQGQGDYAAAMVLGNLGIQFANFGIHWSNNHFVAQERKLLPRLIANGLWAGLGIGGILALVILGISRFWPGLTPVGSLLALVLAWIPLSLTYLLFQALLLGLQKNTSNNIIELVGRILKVLLMAGLWLLGWVRVDLFFAAAFLSVAVCFLLNFRVLIPLVREPLRASWSLFKNHMSYGLRAYISTFFSFLVLRIDQLMVQYQAGSTQTGFYATAVSMGDAVFILPAVISAVLFPRLSALKSFDKKWRKAKEITWMTALGLVPLFLLTGIVAKPVLDFLFGDQYLPSVGPFLWLLPGLYFLSIQWVASRFLYSVGFPKSLLASWGAAALLNIGLNFWVIPKWGIVGASAASSATYCFILVLTLWVIRRQVGARMARAHQGRKGLY